MLQRFEGHCQGHDKNDIFFQTWTPDQIRGIIDIRAVLPMVETREFQALGDKRQLGMTYLVFPSATHTRKPPRRCETLSPP